MPIYHPHLLINIFPPMTLVNCTLLFFLLFSLPFGAGTERVEMGLDSGAEVLLSMEIQGHCIALSAALVG